MAVYTFKPVPVWGSVGRTVRLGGAAGATYPLTDPSGAPVTVNETGKTYVTADANGLLPTFHTTDVPTVLIQLSPGITVKSDSVEAVAGAASYASAASTSATDAANSATSAATARDDAVAAASSSVKIADRPVSLRGQSGIDWTGGTDSSAAVQAVINSAGVGAKIDMGVGGVIRCNTGLTLLDFQTLEGIGPFIGTGTAPTRLHFTGLGASGVGITGGASNVLRNLHLLGPGYTASGQTGFKSSTSSARFEGVQWYSWPTAVSLTGAYYATFDRCDWQYNAIGLQLTNCFNVNLVEPKFRCSNEARTSFGQGINTGIVRGLNVFGGSIEDFGPTAGVFAGNQSQVNLYGTYFESGVTGAGGIGIDAGTKTSTGLGLYGCLVYLTELNRWVNYGGGTAQSLKAAGNKFICPTTSGTTPYAYTLSSSGTGEVDISGDNWGDVQKGNYLGGSAVLPKAGVRIAPPTGAANAGTYYMGLAKIVQQAAQADTTGATLAALETEVNGLKAKLRTLGLMAP